MDVSTDPDFRSAWVAEPVDCHACAALERARDPGKGKRTPKGRKFSVRNRATT